MRMNRLNAREKLARTCDEFYKITGEKVGLIYTWGDGLTIHGPPGFKQHIASHRDQILECLAFSTMSATSNNNNNNNNNNMNQKQNKSKNKLLQDDYMMSLLFGNLQSYKTDNLRSLVSWATQKTLGCGRNFWGVEKLKPYWWPQQIQFNLVNGRRSRHSKKTLIDILKSYISHNNIINKNETTNNATIIVTSTPIKRIRSMTPLSAAKRSKIYEDDILHDSDQTQSSYFGFNEQSLVNSSPVSATEFQHLIPLDCPLKFQSQPTQAPISVQLSSSNFSPLKCQFQSKSQIPISVHSSPVSATEFQHLNPLDCQSPKILRQSIINTCVQELSSPNTWITDTTIYAFCEILKSSVPVNGLQHSIFSQTLCQQYFKHYFKKASIWPSMQIHYNDNRHWVCSYSSMENQVFLYDSLYNRRTTASLDTQLALIYGRREELVVTVPSIQQQRGTSDCGLFAAAAATALAYGQDPSKLTWDQSIMRQHLKECLECEKMTPFPTLTTKATRTNKVPKPHQIKIKLYCDCNLPEWAYVDDGSDKKTHMVCCEKCNNWYHNRCYNLPDISNIKGNFSCNACINK